MYRTVLGKSGKVIERENQIEIKNIVDKYCLNINGTNEIYKKALFFDLEHYVYKKPICVGVFGCCYYDFENKNLNVKQYMIENVEDSKKILFIARDYFLNMKNNYDKDYIITFSGNNDFTIINYLFNKFDIDFNISQNYKEIDLQKEYEKEKKTCIGLKALEKEFDIVRDSELISGQNLAKTFSKIMKDSDYIKRMPSNKIQKILLYNEQDVVSLFHIYTNWNRVMP